MSHKRNKRSIQQEMDIGENTTIQQSEGETSPSFLSSARSMVSNNKGLITAVGLTGVAAAYLLGTEHGRSMQSRIGDTMRDSFSDIRDTVSNNLTKLRSTVQDVINRFGSEAELESESVREKLRRVV